MSHYAVVKVQIKNPNRTVLERALRNIADYLGGVLSKDTEVYGYRFARRVDYLVQVRLPYGNGYGVKINSNGEVVVHVDDHGAPLTAEQFQEMLQREYMAEAVKAVMQELGYEVEEERQEEAITIKALGW